MRIAAGSVCVTIVLVLTGCSSLNPFSSKKASSNVPAELTEFKQTMDARSAWSVNVGKAGDFVFTPAYTYDSIFAAAADGTIIRLDAASGREQWRINADVPLTAGVGSDGDTVAVAGEKGVILAFDANGKLRWKAQASSEILSAPAVGGGLVIVKSMDNRIAAFDSYSGARKWAVQRTAPLLTLRSSSGIVIANSNAIIALPGGRLLALSLLNGGVRWEIALGDPRGATELERIADVSGFPVVFERQVCAVTYQGRVGCVDLVNGAAQWGREFSSDVGLGIDERFVFAANEKGSVHAFTRDGGQSVWRNDKLAYRRLTTPVSFGRAVAVGDGMGYMHFLNREDGSLIGRMSSDGSPILSTPLIAGDKLVFQTRSGTLMAVTTE